MMEGDEMANTYYVAVKEVYVLLVRVEANSPKEARDKVNKGEGQEGIPNFYRRMPTDTWLVEDKQGNILLD